MLQISKKAFIRFFIIAPTFGMLMACEGQVDFQQAEMNFLSNTPPVANAGNNQNTKQGSQVQLDASDSSDAEQDGLSYSWAITSKPQSSNTSLNKTTIVNPVFTVDMPGSYTLSLIVNDGEFDSQPSYVTVMSTADNSAPVANAGNDQNVITGSLVSLNGSDSSDANDDELSFNWVLSSRPSGSNASLSSTSSVTPSFTADKDGSYMFILTVNDGQINSQSDSVIINSTTSNSVPVANAGINQNIETGSQVTLDGSASSDANQDSLSFNWVLSAKPIGSNASLSSTSSVTPSFTADLDGAYVLTLVVNDGKASSQSDSVVISSSTSNSAPVANAGIDQNVETGTLVTLDGSASSDANNDSLSFVWVLSAKPTGSNASLSSTSSVTPSFTADLDGAYVLTLVVNDGKASSQSDSVVITSSTSNSAPVADAGIDQNIETGTLVTLDGSASSDANNDSLSFSWVLSSRPDGSNASLNSASSVTPTFTPDIDGSYVATLIVSDGQVSSQFDTVVITSSTSNSTPVANAGIDQSVFTASVVTLDGSGSSDANADSLSYNWVMLSRPVNSNASLVSASSSSPTFTADKDGNYVISLTVNDGMATSLSDSVTITSSTENSAPLANAGIDQNVTTGSLVTLDGSASTDINGDTLSYSWVLNVPSGSGASLNSTTAIMPSFTADIDGTYQASLVVNDGLLSSQQSDSVFIQSTTPAPPASDFDSFDGSGALIGYTTNNQSDLPDVTRTNGRYRANLVDNTNDKTLHFNNVQGRLDAKQVSFPFEVIARNIGIGTQTNSQLAPAPNGYQYIFAGIQVHVLSLTERNSSHIVIGHRGGTSFTIEGKNTVNGYSTVDDAGYNIAPDGRVDLRIVGNADRTITVYWQQPNLSGSPDNWQFYEGYDSGAGRLPGIAPNYAADVYVGLITYAQGTSNIPFVGTCDSFEIIQ